MQKLIAVLVIALASPAIAGDGSITVIDSNTGYFELDDGTQFHASDDISNWNTGDHVVTVEDGAFDADQDETTGGNE